MANVIYKKGQYANLDDVAITEGQILVTEDTGEMYVDISNNTRKKISDTEKQNTLKSGENIKTINGESILGSGNIEIEGGSGTGTITNDALILIDNTSGKEYKIYVNDGKLQLEEVNE